MSFSNSSSIAVLLLVVVAAVGGGCPTKKGQKAASTAAPAATSAARVRAGDGTAGEPAGDPSPWAIARGPDLLLPRSTANGSVERVPALLLTRRGLYLTQSGVRQLVVELDAGAVPTAAKEGGRAASYWIEPLSARLRQLPHRRRMALAVDRTTSCRTLSEVLHTLEHTAPPPAEVYLLARGATTGVRALPIMLWTRGKTPDLCTPASVAAGRKNPINLTLGVSTSGIAVGGSSSIFPSIPCKALDGTGRCPTKAGERGDWSDGYDYPALAGLAAEIKRVYPDERCVIVTGEGQLPLQVIVNVIDTLRGAGFDRPLMAPSLF